MSCLFLVTDHSIPQITAQQAHIYYLLHILLYYLSYFLGKEKKVKSTGEKSQETKKWRNFEARWLIQEQQ